MTDKLRDFLAEKAGCHVPFKRDVDNELYQQKYQEFFEYILNSVPLGDSVNVPATEWRKMYRNYKQVLIDLYNDGLIYFKMSKSKRELLHGNVSWRKVHEDISTGHFVGFYRVDQRFVECILNDVFETFSGRYIDRYMIDTQIHQMKSDRIINKYIVHQNHETVTKSSNEFYHLLTIDGQKLLDDIPHFGKYTDGRIYSKFHSLDRNTRKRIEIGDRGYIKEVFDISHCFPTLIGVLIEGHLNDEVVSTYRKYIMNNDIYSDTLRHSGIEVNRENRNRIKPYFNKFILSTIKDNKRNMKWSDSTNNPILFNAVVSFLREKFPEVFDFIWNFDTTVIKDENGRSKRIKRIAHELQKIEKQIVEHLTTLLPEGIPFVTLHDAIYIGEKDVEKVNQINFENEFRKALNF